MKKLHLVCNAHIDPVWLWTRNEGIAEAVSTFRVAADFCEQYDGFVFNHNEALLYEWVEIYEPELFRRIQRLVKEGKWAVLGGWYLQPDCVMASGESLLSQIRLGREYFREKFGVEPKTAMNVDPFGHTRGLVQLLKMNGYENYVFMRPAGLPRNFIWRGLDGSEVCAHDIFGGYNTLKGKAADRIRRSLVKQTGDVTMCLWGVGNHGGGASKIDLENIQELMAQSDVQIVHSTADEFFAELDKTGLPVVETSLGPVFVGCYTTMVRIKQANRRLENKLAMTGKILCHAEAATGYQPGWDALRQAQKDLAFSQFHDVLPGTAIKPVEEDSLRTMAHGEELADKLFTQAFFKLCDGQEKAPDGQIPIMAYNPHPYPITRDFEVGFMLANQNWNENEVTVAQVYDEQGNPLPTQNIKPDCTFNLDWIEKVVFRATLAPSGITRFNCRLQVINRGIFVTPEQPEAEICVSNDSMRFRISKESGLIKEYTVGGKTLLENTGCIEVYRDDECPWEYEKVGSGIKPEHMYREPMDAFRLMTDEEANRFVGYPEEPLPSVRVVEDGPVCTKVQVFFTYDRSVAVVEYTVPKLGADLDVKITLLSNTPNKLYKYALNSKLRGTPYGETVFGWEQLPADKTECVYHKWCGIRQDDAGLYVLNNGTYGGTFTDSSIKVSLLRTPVYAAHPIRDRQLTPHDRFLEHIDMGQREFSFRITTDGHVQRQAQIFNEAPYLLSFFPSGAGEKTGSFVQIDNPQVILSSVRKEGDGYELLLCNYSDSAQEASVRIPGSGTVHQLRLGGFELKALCI